MYSHQVGGMWNYCIVYHDATRDEIMGRGEGGGSTVEYSILEPRLPCRSWRVGTGVRRECMHVVIQPMSIGIARKSAVYVFGDPLLHATSSDRRPAPRTRHVRFLPFSFTPG